MALKARVLVVDDEEVVRLSIGKILEMHGFEVELAGDAPTAIDKIAQARFDVLLTDLRMAGPEDGIAVVKVMRSVNPTTAIFLMSAYPNISTAAATDAFYADEIVPKPIDIPALLKIIKHRLAGEIPASRVVESVAAILDRSIMTTVEDWLRRVEDEPKLIAISLDRNLRIAYVPRILGDLVLRLRSTTSLEGGEEISLAAQEHGVLRHQQGYSAAMMVQESRLLQVSIYHTLHSNLESIDFSMLLLSVMTIADEVDSQLSQAMESYVMEAGLERLQA